ncbi:MAG TPA: ABC transporter ATP-binding protein [Flavipsychrobacter sp.]|nr:ABC transporter ATP-binding protein [Flavipsychrobacter sp.]
MKNLAALKKYFIRYRWRLLLGMLFVAVSNLFAVMAPNIVGKVIDEVAVAINDYKAGRLVVEGSMWQLIAKMVFWPSIAILGLALLRGIFMFFMRQTIIVMSRHIEFDQKNDIYNHYQELSTGFFKKNFTGDLMNRLSEDVSRVRMYTGPAIMYSTNLIVLTLLAFAYMFSVNVMLTIYVIIPLPILALSIYLVNSVIYKKSEKIQAQLSSLTTTAQESYSGIRVIKSFVQEKNMLSFFNNTSEEYKKSAINLGMTEAVYFPAMNLFIGLSMLSTIAIGGYYAIQGEISTGNIAEFIIYINLLMFPIMSIGWVASMVQRASASQARINEFLHTKPDIVSPLNAEDHELKGKIELKDISFTYPHTGITALKNFSLNIQPGQKVAIIGTTGSGKSTLIQLLLRMYDAQQGKVLIDDVPVQDYNIQSLRRQIAFAPQESLLFSDAIYNNIRFGKSEATDEEVKAAARLADLDKDLATFEKGYETVIGERGVMLSGGQKQRMVLARALLKDSKVLILDEVLSAVDTQTEKNILHNLQDYLIGKTTIVITHRIFTSWNFDQVIVLDKGEIVEQGSHHDLMNLNGRYAALYKHQTETGESPQE